MIDGRVMYSRGRYDAWVETPTFGEYAQVWLNNREAVEGTRDNYKGTLNLYWMPHFATTRIDEIGGADIRRGAETSWTSPGVRRNARDKMASVMKSALTDGCYSTGTRSRRSPGRARRRRWWTRSPGRRPKR